jgi:hypothetical protein
VMKATAMEAMETAATKSMRGSGGGSQRDGAEGSGGNECESQFAKHDRSPQMCASKASSARG